MSSAVFIGLVGCWELLITMSEKAIRISLDQNLFHTSALWGVLVHLGQSRPNHQTALTGFISTCQYPITGVSKSWNLDMSSVSTNMTWLSNEFLTESQNDAIPAIPNPLLPILIFIQWCGCGFPLLNSAPCSSIWLLKAVQKSSWVFLVSVNSVLRSWEAPCATSRYWTLVRLQTPRFSRLRFPTQKTETCHPLFH